jgi:sigma-B regulation protein RsbU (phosphoserine phosphatase)
MPDISDRQLYRLKGAVDELAALNDIANAINVTMSIDDITRSIVDRCLKRVSAAQGAIFLLDEKEKEEDKEERFKTFVREIDPAAGQIPFHLNTSLTGWMIKNKAILVSNDPGSDERLRGVDFSNLGINSILAAPLLSRKGLLGLLVLFNKTSEEGFNDNDKRFVGIVGTQTSKVIENARLFEKELQLMAVTEETRVAHDIQQRLLPQENIAGSMLEIQGVSLPAKDVGGDFYDMYQIDDDQVFISLGDVSGKGIPAALLMASAQAALRSQCTNTSRIELTAVADSVNRLICQFTSPGQYITCLFGLFALTEGVFRFVNAGHLPPLIVRADGSIFEPEGANLVFGIVPDCEYTIHDATLGKGDTLVLYTDGVTEAFNESQEEFGERRFKEFLPQHGQKSADDIGKLILTELETFRGEADQSDDTTMLILKVK